ncbi:NAD(P)-binding domain-containing protein [Gordonia sp. CPCC 205515]|uniref:flavin-containing monooxygenase n=1 Tax=Gordonia sp. CPCC 205515 TaxID=3140791 RepID=UPI003AF3634C
MRVCVVGAGPCGLTTIKQLRDEGHEVVCFDKNPDVGGIWLRHDGDDTEMKAFDNLMLTISMKLMAYSDHPFTGGRMFVSRQQYYGYLREYAERFRLRDHIRFGSEVTDVRRRGRTWTVTVRRDGIETTEEFGAVAICSGPFKTPNMDIPELADFSGEIVHSAHYRNNERFRGKRVLVVGLAESGADIVREIGDVAEACTLSIRSYSWLLPRIFNGNQTTDRGTVRAHHHEMLRRATDKPFPLQTFWGQNPISKAAFLTTSVALGFGKSITSGFRGELARRTGRAAPLPDPNPMGEPVYPFKMDIGTADSPENWDMLRTWNRRSHPDGSWTQRAIFSKNVTFIPSLVSGQVQLNDAGIERTDGKKVFFSDATSAEFDTVVLCTGFSKSELSVGDLRVKDGNVRNLYKHFLPAEHDGTAAFIGFVRPFSGGIPICAEMQARYFAQLCSGTLRLPADVDERIAQEKEWEEYWTALSPRHTESIPSQVVYLDSLAKEIGCLVPMRRMLLNPKLFIQLWFGTFNQAGYRIVGPHSRGEAALEDLYSEPVVNLKRMVFDMALLQLMPSKVHPKHMM